jgi:hypothetical protein
MSSKSFIENTIESSESINFQINNKLGSNLEALFQDVIDYRDKLIEKEGYQYDPALLDKVYFYIKDSKFKDKFKDIIEKGLGIKLKSIKLTIGQHNGASGMFYVDPSWSDISTEHGWDVHEAWEKQYEGTANTLKNISPHIIDDIIEFAEIAEGFDASSAKFKTTKYAHKNYIIAQMGFCVNTAFLSNAFILSSGTDDKLKLKYKQAGIEHNSQLTAKEITAIMLHECGHVMTMLERSADFTHQFIRINEVLKYNLKYGDKKQLTNDIIKQQDKITKLVNTHAKSYAGVINKHINLVCKAGSILVDLQDSIDVDSSLEGWLDGFKDKLKSLNTSKHSFLSGIIGTGLFGCIFVTYIWFLAIILIFAFVNTLSVMLVPGDTKYKTSDTNVNRRNWFQNERAADEFSVKQGYAQYLTEGLRKIYLISNNSTIYWSSSPFMQNSSVFNMIQNILGSILPSVLGFSTIENLIYEDNIITGPMARIDRIRETLMSVFKDPSIPNDIKDHYVEDIKRMNISQSLFRSQHHKDEGLKNLTNIISYLTFVPTTKFISMLVNGHLNQDYVKLQNQLDSLMNNELFYQSHRLNKLLRNK